MTALWRHKQLISFMRKAASMPVDVVRHAFTVQAYARMLAAGILHEDDRVELIDGEVRQMSPIGPYHAALVARLNRLLTRQTPDHALARTAV